MRIALPWHRVCSKEGTMNTSSRRWQKAFYAAGNIGNGVYSGFNNAILSLYLTAFTSNPFLLGYLSNTQTMEGVVIQPLVGRWSDRMRSPLGRRRPFLLIGVPVSVFFLCLIPVAAHDARSVALPLIAASIILFSITWNVASDPNTALMVDITTAEERPVFNAILAMISLVGQVGIVLYASVASLGTGHALPDVIFYLCAALMVGSYAVVFLGVREPKETMDLAAVEERVPLRVYLRDLRSFREAFKLLTSIFLLWTGLHAVIPFLTLFPVKVLGASNAQALIVYVVLILTSAVLSYPAGRLGVRYGNRRMVVLGTVTLVLAAMIGVVVPSYLWMFPLAMLAGCGFAATNALTYPLLAELIPAAKVGVFTGIQTAFGAAAVPVSILITGTLISHVGYRSIFAVLAVMMVLDIAVLLSIDLDAAHEQVRRVEDRERTLAEPEATAVLV
jgi:Na+/melibiose symporter-like transporter